MRWDNPGANRNREISQFSVNPGSKKTFGLHVEINPEVISPSCEEWIFTLTRGVGVNPEAYEIFFFNFTNCVNPGVISMRLTRSLVSSSMQMQYFHCWTQRLWSLVLYYKLTHVRSGFTEIFALPISINFCMKLKIDDTHNVKKADFPTYFWRIVEFLVLNFL